MRVSSRRRSGPIKAWRDTGHPGDGAVDLRAPDHLAATEQAARAEAEASLMHYARAQGALLADSAWRAGVDAADRRTGAAERLMALAYEKALRGFIMIGAPESVTARRRDLQRGRSLAGVLLEINCGGKVQHAEEKEALRLLC